MTEIVIRITVPDGVDVRVEQAAFAEASVEPVVRTMAHAPVGTSVSNGWAAGQIHAQGHKPLKPGQKGLFCPTKLQDGSWCQFPR